ncbi:hypothetical protein ACJJIC_15450 [Microbulbifer sp. ANSA002]|uniref:hypothetical protein n=1 Tax=unclassified Microbulbifer TaxID=2619833 RepID=UPI00404267CB
MKKLANKYPQYRAVLKNSIGSITLICASTLVQAETINTKIDLGGPFPSRLEDGAKHELGFAGEQVAPPGLDFNYFPSEFIIGESTVGRWSSSNATECHNSSGTKLSLVGSWTNTPISVGLRSSTITCTGPGGSVTKTAIYTVLPYPEPTLNFSYTPREIFIGEYTLGTWASNSASECHNSSGTNLDLSGSWENIPKRVGLGSSTIICTGSSGSVTQTALYNVVDLLSKDYYYDQLLKLKPESFKDTITNSVIPMYSNMPAIDGLVEMYQATGDKKLIRHALDISLAYQNNGYDFDGDGYLDWSSDLIPQGYSHGHYEWRAAMGIAIVAARVLTDPALSSDPLMKSDAENLVNFVETHVWDKWEKSEKYKGRLSNIRVTHFVGRVGMIALSLYQTSLSESRKKEYKNFIEVKGRQLKDSLELHGNAYDIRCYMNPIADCSSEKLPVDGTIDVGHAGDTVNFIIASYQHNFVFELQDLSRLANAVKYNIWNGETRNDVLGHVFNDNVDGSAVGNIIVGRNQGAWVKLSKYDAELKSIYRIWSSFDSNLYPNVATKAQVYGAIANTLD